jgi:hypothetical protein
LTALKMLGRKVRGWNLVSKNLDIRSEAPSERWTAGYNEGNQF